MIDSSRLTEENFEQLEQEERFITDEAILLMIALLGTTKTNIRLELLDFYQRYGKDGVVTYQEARKWVGAGNKRKRLTILSEFVSSEFQKTLAHLTPEFKGMLVKIIKLEGDFFDLDLDTDILDTKWGADNKNWNDRLKNDVKLWRFRIWSDIVQSLIKRESIDKVLERLDSRFTSAEKVLKALVLTESSAMGSLSRNAIFDELGVTKYKFYAMYDERRCDQCGSLHGLVFPMSAYQPGVTASPIHTHCRCWEVPIVD